MISTRAIGYRSMPYTTSEEALTEPKYNFRQQSFRDVLGW